MAFIEKIKRKTESNSVKGNEKSKLFTFFFFCGIILLVYLLGAEKSEILKS